jgi:hypothetical protein
MTTLERPTTVLLGCVADNKPAYLSQSLRLLQSVRWFGGTLADAPFYICCVDAVDPWYRTAFERLGATVRIVRRFHEANPFPNKLRFLELAEETEFDTIVLLDCDTIMVQDAAPFLATAGLGARIAGYPTVSTKVFRKLFSRFGLRLPPEDYRCAVSGDATIWYCNTGVVSFAADVLREFLPVWRGATQALCDDRSLLRTVKNMCEQASLTLAFFKHPVPFVELPLSMNCPIPPNLTGVMEDVRSCDPAIIHYHRQVDAEGLIVSNANPFARRRIIEFNERCRREGLRGSP